jgi:hypothetical protein
LVAVSSVEHLLDNGTTPLSSLDTPIPLATALRPPEESGDSCDTDGMPMSSISCRVITEGELREVFNTFQGTLEFWFLSRCHAE